MAIIRLDYDLADVQSDFEPLPVGTYAARIAEATLETASTGNAMIRVVWEVADGEFQGRKLFDNVVLTVPWKVKQYAQLVGIESGQEIDLDAFVGAEAIVEVTQEEYQGEIRNRVKRVRPVA
ncbi:hypothetical protein DRN93_05805 [archaeon]|nr:MAG: hypothetical protein DRN93_05805 [archaeon]